MCTFFQRISMQWSNPLQLNDYTSDITEKICQSHTLKKQKQIQILKLDMYYGLRGLINESSEIHLQIPFRDTSVKE